MDAKNIPDAELEALFTRIRLRRAHAARITNQKIIDLIFFLCFLAAFIFLLCVLVVSSVEKESEESQLLKNLPQSIEALKAAKQKK